MIDENELISFLVKNRKNKIIDCQPNVIIIYSELIEFINSIKRRNDKIIKEK